MKCYLRPNIDFVEALIFIIMSKEKICGIYKITSPTGKVYIGQSKNIHKRWNSYKNMSKGNIRQPKLINSFKKYGVEHHVFEILEICNFEDLNCRERYWQDEFDVIGENGLNCTLIACENNPKVMTNFGENHSGAKVYINLETGVFYHGIREASESVSHISYNSLKFMLLGRYLNTSYIVNVDNYIDNPDSYLQTKKLKKVINVKTKEVYKSIMDVTKIYGLDESKLRNRLGIKNNKSGFMFLDEYEKHPNKETILEKPIGKSSKHIGIYYAKKDKRWIAHYKHEGEKHIIGYYLTEEEAYKAYTDYFKKYPKLEPKVFRPLI